MPHNKGKWKHKIPKYQYWWDAVKTELRGKCIGINAYIKERWKISKNYLTLQLKELGKEG